LKSTRHLAVETIQRYGCDGSAFEHVRTSIDLLCVFARREKIQPEQVIVELKHRLATLPEIDRLSPSARDDIRSRVVACAVKAYFSEGPKP
jgi:hypothetical protein